MKHNLETLYKAMTIGKDGYSGLAELELLKRELRERMIPDEKVRKLLKEADEKKDWKRFAEILIAASMSSRITIKEVLGE